VEGTGIDIEIGEIQTKNISLEKVLLTAILNRLGIAAWRSPGKNEIHLIICFTKIQALYTHPNLEELQPGFLISPYENENNMLQYFITADLHFVFGDMGLSSYTQDHKLSEKSVGEFLKEVSENNIESIFRTADNSSQNSDQHRKGNFESLVRLSVEKIRSGDFQKVVPSRKTEIDLPDGFNLSTKFMELCKLHPGAFVSLFSLSGKDIWIGASPELLISITAGRFFHTSAVAGTQSGKNIQNLSEVAWTQKEIEEQALVSRYIINNFKKIRLREFEEEGPKTVKAGGLLHLRTDYWVDLEAVNFPQLGSVMLKLLHPTSAVCGMPKESASTFLKDHEDFDREFYSGYLGPVNIRAETSIYVNLRCAKINESKAILYAGAGVTRDSNPEKEWHETKLKMSTIKEVLLSE
jgi:isochorismate synthase